MPVRRLIITLAIIAPILALLAFGFTRDAKYIKSPLLAKPATPFSVTLYDGRKVALEDYRGKALFLNFWASWCAPCRAMAPVFEQAAGRIEPAARFAKLNTEDAGAVAARHGIRSIPTLVVFKGGQEVARQTGAMDASSLDRWLATNLP